MSGPVTHAQLCCREGLVAGPKSLCFKLLNVILYAQNWTTLVAPLASTLPVDPVIQQLFSKTHSYFGSLPSVNLTEKYKGLSDELASGHRNSVFLHACKCTYSYILVKHPTVQSALFIEHFLKIKKIKNTSFQSADVSKQLPNSKSTPDNIHKQKVFNWFHD